MSEGFTVQPTGMMEQFRAEEEAAKEQAATLELGMVDARTPDAVGELRAKLEAQEEKQRVDPVFVTDHTYLSTACMHRQHEACRGSCKFCAQSCVCHCHSIPAA